MRRQRATRHCTVFFFKLENPWFGKIPALPNIIKIFQSLTPTLRLLIDQVRGLDGQSHHVMETYCKQ
jgi:hypothetical protein